MNADAELCCHCEAELARSMQNPAHVIPQGLTSEALGTVTCGRWLWIFMSPYRSARLTGAWGFTFCPQSSLDEATDPWGIKVERVEV